MDITELNFDSITLVSLAIYAVIPLLVGVVTRSETPAAVKSLTLTALSIVAGVLTEYVESTSAGAGFDWNAAATAAAVAFGTAVAAYYGLLKPTEFAPKVNARVGLKSKNEAALAA